MENYVNYNTDANSPKDESTTTAPAIIGNDLDKSPSCGDSNKMALTDNDNTKVKFTNANHAALAVDRSSSRNGEAKVEIEGIHVAFAGMGKEELMKFANDPFWIRLRWALLILFWFVWLSMLVGAVVIVVFAKRCDPLPTLDWWQKNVVYELAPAHFHDSDGDGVGDLNGIASRIEYLDDLGVKTLSLGSIYASDGANGVDGIVNHTQIDPQYGSMDNFTSLITALNEKDIKVVMAFVPGRTSKNSEWFEKSRQGVDDYKDYYIWKAEGTAAENTQNDVDKQLWTFDERRKQYYMHDVHERPILNFKSFSVQNELKNIMNFWLNLGVMGFQLKEVQSLLPEEQSSDQLMDKKDNTVKISYPNVSYEFYQSGLSNPLAQWRHVLTNYEEEHGGGHRLLILDTDQDINTAVRYYGNESSLVDFPVNVALQKALNGNATGSSVTSAIVNYMDALPPKAWPNWKIGVNDQLTKNPQLIDGLHMITMLLIGTPITTSGEELGLVEKANRLAPLNITEIESERHEAQSRITEQMAKSHSHLKVFKQLVKLRKQDAIKFGSLGIMNVADSLVIFSRIKKGTPGFLVVANFDNSSVVVDLKQFEAVSTKYGANEASKVDFKFPDDGTLELTSSNVVTGSALYNVESKVKVKFNNIAIGPFESIVIKFVPSFIKE